MAEFNNTLAICNGNRPITVFDVGNWKAIKTISKLRGVFLKNKKHIIQEITFSHNGRYLAGGSPDSLIRIWDTQNNWNELEPIKLGRSYIMSLSFSPDNKYLAAGGFDKIVKIWEIHNLWNDKEIGNHDNNISSIRFSPDGNFLVSGSFDGIIKIWDVKNNWKLIKSIDIGMKQLRFMEFYPDYDRHKILIAGGANLIIKLINMENSITSGKILKTILFKVECSQHY